MLFNDLQKKETRMRQIIICFMIVIELQREYAKFLVYLYKGSYHTVKSL